MSAIVYVCVRQWWVTPSSVTWCHLLPWFLFANCFGIFQMEWPKTGMHTLFGMLQSKGILLHLCPFLHMLVAFLAMCWWPFLQCAAQLSMCWWPFLQCAGGFSYNVLHNCQCAGGLSYNVLHNCQCAAQLWHSPTEHLNWNVCFLNSRLQFYLAPSFLRTVRALHTPYILL